MISSPPLPYVLCECIFFSSQSCVFKNLPEPVPFVTVFPFAHLPLIFRGLSLRRGPASAVFLGSFKTDGGHVESCLFSIPVDFRLVVIFEILAKSPYKRNPFFRLLPFLGSFFVLFTQSVPLLAPPFPVARLFCLRHGR